MYIEEHNITGIHNGAVTTSIWLGAIERCEIVKKSDVLRKITKVK